MQIIRLCPTFVLLLTKIFMIFLFLSSVLKWYLVVITHKPLTYSRQCESTNVNKLDMHIFSFNQFPMYSWHLKQLVQLLFSSVLMRLLFIPFFLFFFSHFVIKYLHLSSFKFDIWVSPIVSPMSYHNLTIEQKF